MVTSSNFFRCALLLVMLFIAHFRAQSQNEYIDSVRAQLKVSKEDTNKVKLLNDLCWELAFVKTEEAISFGKRGVRLSEKLKYTSGESIGRYYLGRIYVEIGKAKLALEETKKALEIDSKSGDVYAIASDHGQIGACYKTLGNYDKAMFHYYQSLELFEKMGNVFAAAQTRLNLASFSLQHEEYAETIKLAQEAGAVFRQAEAQQMLARALSLEASALSKLKRWDQSMKLYKESLRISQELEDQIEIAATFNNFGLYFYERNQSDSAVVYFDKALVIQESLGRNGSAAVTLANKALAHLALKEQEKSMESINRSIELGKEAGELFEIASMMSYAAEIYYNDGDYRKAYDYLQISRDMKDTLLSERKTEQMFDIREKYESEKREQRIETLKKERDASEAKSRLVDTVIIFSIGIILLLIVLVFYILRQRKAKEQQRKIELEQKVLRAQMNPHFIFNSLNSIQRIFIEGDVDLANEYISDFGKLLRIILENNGKKRVSIQNEVETLKLYLDIESIRLEGKIEYTIDISPKIDVLNNLIPPLIIQPFVENAIWHGILPKEDDEMGVIVVSLDKESDKFLICSITDNGIGIKKSLEMKGKNGHVSKGMSITEERLGHKIQVEEMDAGGTKVTLKIPLNL